MQELQIGGTRIRRRLQLGTVPPQRLTRRPEC